MVFLTGFRPVPHLAPCTTCRQLCLFPLELCRCRILLCISGNSQLKAKQGAEQSSSIQADLELVAAAAAARAALQARSKENAQGQGQGQGQQGGAEVLYDAFKGQLPGQEDEVGVAQG